MDQPAKALSRDGLSGKLKRGDKHSFDLLYANYSPAIYGFIHQLTPDKELSEKIFVEAFNTIWHQLDGFDPSKQRLFSWLLAIVRTTAAKISSETQIRTATDIVFIKDALSLIYLKGLSARETAAILNISEKELNTHLHSQVLALRTTVIDK